MQVIMVCADETEARYVRDNAETIEEALRGALFWPQSMATFDVVPSLRPPTQRELVALMNALGGFSDEQRMEWEYAELDQLATRDGRKGVYRP